MQSSRQQISTRIKLSVFWVSDLLFENVINKTLNPYSVTRIQDLDACDQQDERRQLNNVRLIKIKCIVKTNQLNYDH